MAALAASTFAVSSLYMVLANYGLVLFTGRNTYLLAQYASPTCLFLIHTWPGACRAKTRPDLPADRNNQ